MNYYISDYYFGYQRVNNIDKHTFKSEEERNSTIITNWSSYVMENDTGYIFGDLIWNSEYRDAAVYALKELN